MKLGFFFILSLFCCLLYSCKESSEKGKDKTDHSDFGILKPDHVIAMGKPKMHRVNFDSVLEVKFEVKIEKPAIGARISDIRTPMHKATISNIPLLPSSFKTVTLGADVPLPKTYEIPNSGYRIQYGDTIFAPVKTKIKQPESQPIGPMEVMPNNVKDISFLNADSGLPYSYFWCVMEDSKNYLWFGSAGLGLIRYNGRSFETYDKNIGLYGNYVNCLFEDRDQNIWLGTNNVMGTYDNGITRYDGHYFYNYDKKQGFSSYPVHAIYQDSKGVIWVGTEGDGIQIYKKEGTKETVTKYTPNNGLLGENVFSFIEDEDGSMWIATNNGICNFDGEKFTSFPQEKNNAMTSVTKDGQGQIWFSNKNSLNKYNSSSLTKIEASIEGINFTNYIESISADDNGHLWLATWYGLVYFDGAIFRIIDDTNGLNHSMVSDISKDKSGNIWAATFGGIHKLKVNSFESYSSLAGISNKYINALTNDKIEGLWMGSKNIEGIIRHRDHYFQHYFIKDAYTEFVFSDNANNIWFGGLKKAKFPVSKYDGRLAHRYKIEGFSDADKVMGITEDLDGNIWLATLEGLFKFDGERILKFDEKNGSPDKILKIDIDKKGNLWFCTRSGLSMFDGTSFATYTEKNGLATNYLYSFIFDKDQNILLSSRKGLSLLTFNEDRSALAYSHNYEKSNAANYDMALTLLEDDDDNIWAGSNKGINQLSPTIQLGVYNQVSFTKGDGYLAGRGLLNGRVLDEKNTIWWGAPKGIVSLDLNRLDLEYTKPSVRLNEIEINQKFIDFRRLEDSTYTASIPFGASLKKAVGKRVVRFENYPKTMTLPHTLNHLNFKFSAMDWKSPNAIQYQYKLEGHDETWNELSTDNFATYRKISQGDYSFKVKALGKTGLWSETFSYDFTITPPWWHTWWARVLYLLIAVWLIYAIVKIRANAIRKEFVEKERIWAITDKQNKRFQDFSFITSHNIRIAAANLIGLHHLLRGSADPKLFEMLDATDYKLGNSIEHMNQLLHTDDFTKKSKKKLYSLRKAVDKAVDKNKDLIDKQSASLKIDISDDLEVLTLTKYLDNIVHQLIKNALLFGVTDSSKNINISAGKENGTVTLTVKDYGLGINMELYQDKIFNLGGRFHPDISDGEGLGLYISKNQITTLGWDIKVESQIDKGSTFKVVCHG